MAEFEIKESFVNSSIYELKEFLDSIIWDDFQREIGVWIEELGRLLREESDLTELHRIQGRMQALEHVLQLPANMLEAKTIDFERDRRNG